MKRISAKKRKQITDNYQWRRDFILESDGCMLCGGKLFERRAAGHVITSLAVHEILRGKNRDKAQERREACLVLCDGVGDTCHRKVQDWKLPKQLALKWLKDQEWFSLKVIRELLDNGRKPVVVTKGDVEREVKKMFPLE